ncbi:MAG TPA: DUF6064 family protein [Ramlibacter sp.]|uniref:DUF6064 family protein n=1 Tax=Ramlibacter sp. TaxID=1917967 RepID=UPI002ED49F52
MTEWWSYGLSDFLMFSPQAYWRLVARHNAAWWPAQLAGAAACLALLWIALRGGSARVALAIVAIAWGFTGWAFHRERYAEIFLGAPWAAAACGVEAALLVAAMFAAGVAPAPRARQAGMSLTAIALLFPLLSFAQGRSWPEAEVFGFLPDPTALATLGTLLAVAMPARRRIALAIVPLLSLAFGLATRWLVA